MSKSRANTLALGASVERAAMLAKVRRLNRSNGDYSHVYEPLIGWIQNRIERCRRRQGGVGGRIKRDRS